MNGPKGTLNDDWQYTKMLEPESLPSVTKTVTMSPRSKGAQLLMSLTAFLVVIVIFLGFNFVSNTADDATDQSRKNETLIQDLKSQIEKSNLVVEDDRIKNAGKVECYTRFTYAIQAASSDLLATVGDLVVIIATTVPGPEREAAIGGGVGAVANAVDKYRSTVDVRIAYDVAGSPLPCPLKPGLTG